ncbi:hypothetical protein NSQ96_14655 [Caldifermentibacillus hisashii]|uniref:Uncharacterized protein n=2 Tax=Bacillaceae TaxID=186817 RepID=A0A0D0F934_9BACI|nr:MULTISPECIES: hypothetical protein [Bacillaceae]MCB5934729.1 hypothetical protein [Bacillus sp. DFI.2.34]NWN97741.1 hypothetical protein [Bacillus sp. (in: firmicutes)]KIO60405.1 hypothetical protein B4064_3590 [Caldibacillus thermoamylovorans]KIO60889.1 hypothetical protein B4166_0269 [Caldibacillus thermoamylovorans]KIO61719.1 hypothetical protein B4065_1191 [Caldibacillus thermoamylovorans]
MVHPFVQKWLNYYLLEYLDEVLVDICKELGIDFGKKYMSLGEIKKILGDVKKE